MLHAEALIWGAPSGPWRLHIEPFGALLAVGLALGVLLARRLAQRAGLVLGDGLWALGVAAAVSLVSARVGYLVMYPGAAPWGELLSLHAGGLSGYGALFGAALGAAVTLRRCSERAAWFDVGACGALLAVALGRLGSYVAGSDFGRAFSGPVPSWLARLGSFPRPGADEAMSEAWFVQSLNGAVSDGSPRTPPLHPTALYEAFGVLVVLVVLLAWRPRQRAFGQCFCAAVLALALLRFVVDGLRDGVESGRFSAASLDRAAAVTSALLVCGALVWCRVAQRASSN